MNSGAEMEATAQKALDLARAAGAQQAAVRVGLTHFVEAGFRDGGLDKASASSKRGLTLKLFVDGRYAVHSTSDLRPAALARFVDQAAAMTRLLEPDPLRSLPDPARYPKGPAPDLALYDPALADPAAPEWIERARAMEELARAAGEEAGPRLVSTQGGAYAEMSRTMLATSEGFMGGLSETGCFAGCMVVLLDPKDGAKRRSGGWWEGYRRAAELDAPGRLPAIAAEAARRAAEQIGARPGPSGRWRVLVENAAAGRLLGRLLPALEGRTLHQRRSFLLGRLERPVASPLLTLRDEPLLPAGFASRWFDGEGVAAAPLAIIERGVLRRYYLDTYHARALELPPSAGSPSNLVLEPSNGLDAAGLAAKMDEGLYVTGFLGGNFNTTTGDFSLGVQGHWLRGGKRAHPVEGMNLSGNMLEFLGGLLAVGDDPYPFSAIRSPSLLFGEALLGGVSLAPGRRPG